MSEDHDYRLYARRGPEEPDQAIMILLYLDMGLYGGYASTKYFANGTYTSGRLENLLDIAWMDVLHEGTFLECNKLILNHFQQAQEATNV